MHFFRAFDDRIRAIATYVCLMLVWPVALATAQGLTLEPLTQAESRAVLCTFLSNALSQQQDQKTPVTSGTPCLYCMATGHHSPTADLPPAPLAWHILPAESILPVTTSPVLLFSFTPWVFRSRAPPLTRS